MNAQDSGNVTVTCVIAGIKHEATPAPLSVFHTVPVTMEAQIECGSCVRIPSRAAEDTHWIDSIVNMTHIG